LWLLSLVFPSEKIDSSLKKNYLRFWLYEHYEPLASLDSNTVPSTVPSMRPYQFEADRAILDSVFNREGLTFSIEIALA
jgi:hypothetical protein